MNTSNSRCIWPPSHGKVEVDKMEVCSNSSHNLGKRKFEDSLKIQKPVTYTPLSCLRMLSETGYVFDMEISTMGDETHSEYYSHRWRCEIWESRDGKIRGIGEGPRKILAKEAAVLDLLDNLKKINPAMVVPRCKVPKGSRISPSILVKLIKLCDELEIEPPQYKMDLISVHGRECYETTIAVADALYKERSYDQFYSKLQATYAAYNHVASKKFKLYDFYCGTEECIGEEDVFLAVEYDQVHVVKSQISADQVAKLQRLTNSKRTLPGPSLIAIRKNALERRQRAHSFMDTASTYADDNAYTIVASSARSSPALSSCSEASTAVSHKSRPRERSAFASFQTEGAVSPSDPVVMISRYGSFCGPPPTKILRSFEDSASPNGVNEKSFTEYRHFQSIVDENDTEVEKINTGFVRYR